MPVTDQHSQYGKHIKSIKIVRDCVKGSDAVKKEGVAYLPMLHADDSNTSRYADYKKRALFVNVTGQTSDGLLGMAYRKPPEIELPKEIEAIKTNANGAGLTLSQLSQKITADLLQSGRCGLLVDYPPVAEGVTKADEQAQNIKAKIGFYATESIINWRSTVFGGLKKLTLIVLKETVSLIKLDGFGEAVEDQYRVLRYDPATGYTQQLYDKEGKSITIETIIKASGKALNEIPFVFVGSVNNDEDIDKAPLKDIAEVNIAHYQNSADLEDSSHMVGQPQVVISGLDQQWVKDNYQDQTIVFGSRAPLLLPENGSATMLQAEPNSMPQAGMELKEKQMIALGARLIEDRSVSTTATDAEIKFAAQNSKLAIIANNVESALKQALLWCQAFMGGTGESTFVLNRDFYPKIVDPQTIIAVIQAHATGAIAKTDVRAVLRKGGIIDPDRKDEDIDTEIENENPITGE